MGWDARSAQGWGKLAEGAKAIVNLAGASLKGEGFLPSRWTAKRNRVIRESRVNAGAAVVEAVRAAKRKPEVVVQASAVGYYGARDAVRLDENAQPGDDFPAQVCVEWEQSSQAVEALDVRRCVVRTGLPLTKAGGAFPLLQLPFVLYSGNWFGDGQQFFSWIHYVDEIRALRFLIDTPKTSGAYNLTAPDPVSNREFARSLGNVMRRPVWMPAPGFVMKLALGEVSTVVLDGQRAEPVALLKAGFRFKYPKLDEALRAIVNE
ncbi:MAG: TIGR01777 family oxidoreductase [Chloroflexi bacterium]|nr:TIGR01777 family oxidoreductase [Chloroflexota bacterium]